MLMKTLHYDKIPVKIFSRLNKGAKLLNPELKLVCKNYLGKKKTLFKKNIVFNQSGLSEQIFQLPSDKLGWFALTAEISRNGKKIGLYRRPLWIRL